MAMKGECWLIELRFSPLIVFVDFYRAKLLELSIPGSAIDFMDGTIADISCSTMYKSLGHSVCIRWLSRACSSPSGLSSLICLFWSHGVTTNEYMQRFILVCIAVVAYSGVVGRKAIFLWPEIL